MNQPSSTLAASSSPRAISPPTSTRKRTQSLWTGVYPYLDFTTCLKVRCTQRSSFHAFPFIAITKSHLQQNCSLRALRMCYLLWVANNRRDDVTSCTTLQWLLEVLTETVHRMSLEMDTASGQTEALTPHSDSSTEENPHFAPYLTFLEEIIKDEFSKDEGLLRIFFNRYWIIRFAAIHNNRILLNVLLPYIPKCAPRTICNIVMQRACRHNWLDVVKLLLPHVDLSDKDSLAFRWACEHGALEVVQFLLTILQESDPDLFQTSNFNHYALRYACRNSHGAIVTLLLNDNRLRPSAYPYSRKLLEFIFYESCVHGLSAVVDFLLEHTNVDPSLKSNAAFIQACKNNHITICKSLLRDPRVNPANKENASIKYAAQRGYTAIVELLLEDHRVDPSAGSNSALRRACKYNHVEIVKLLLKKTPPCAGCLVAAVEGGNEDLATLLLEDDRINVSSFSTTLTRSQREAIVNIVSKHAGKVTNGAATR